MTHPSPGSISETAVVMNPHSAGGRTASRWTEIHPLVEAACGRVTVLETASPGHGIQLTREAVRSGHTRVLAIGGDGTLNEVVNGVVEAGPGFEATVGLIPQGTGSDFRRTLGIPLDDEAAVELLRVGKTRRIDLMEVTFNRADGSEQTRYALNVTSFGMGGRVAARANKSAKPLGGKAAFLTATLRTALSYKGDRVWIELDGLTIPDVRITNIAVGNGQYHGAGMWICPHGSVDDGLLDVTVIRKLSLRELLTSGRYLYSGRVYEHTKADFFRTATVSARNLEGVSAVEIDGEPLGFLPIRIAVRPGAIRMIVP